MFVTRFPLALKKDKLNTFALALSYLHTETQGRGNLQEAHGGACLIKPKELQICGAQQEQLPLIQEGRYK